MIELETILVITNAISLLMVAIMAWRAERNIPADTVRDLFEIAQNVVNRTPNTRDDEALELLRKLYAGLAPIEEEAPAPVSPAKTFNSEVA